MRARRSSIPLPKRRLSRLALRWAARRRPDPRSRSRRLVGVFASGATASRLTLCLTGRRCDGVARGPAGASAVGRGGPKGRRGLSRLSGPSLKARAPGRSPALRGRPGRAPAVLGYCFRPLGGSGKNAQRRPRVLRLMLVSCAASVSRFSRARARGRGVPGALGARDSPSGGLIFAGGRAAMLRTDCARPPSGGGRPR